MAKASKKSPEEKLRVVLSVLRGELSVALGRIHARLKSSGKIEVCFLPTGGTRVCPQSNLFNYTAATLDRWYASDWFTFTITADPAARSVSDDGVGMAANPEGEPPPEWGPDVGRLDPRPTDE